MSNGADDEVSEGKKRSAPLAPGVAKANKLRKVAHAAQAAELVTERLAIS